MNCMEFSRKCGWNGISELAVFCWSLGKGLRNDGNVVVGEFGKAGRKAMEKGKDSVACVSSFSENPLKSPGHANCLRKVATTASDEKLRKKATFSFNLTKINLVNKPVARNICTYNMFLLPWLGTLSRLIPRALITYFVFPI